jgi:hypothetical protein
MVVAALVAATSAFAGGGCAKTAPDEKTSEAKETSAAEETTVAKSYTCPMHPEVTSDAPGECPTCGMDLVAKDDEGTGTAQSGK